MSKQPCLPARDTLQPLDSSPSVPTHGLEFPICPSRQRDVDVPQRRVERRRVEPPVVVNPATDVHIEHPRQIVQGLVTPFMEGPAADRLADYLESFVTGRWAKRDAHLSAPSARQPRPESIAEEVELVVGMASASIIILAVDDLRLFGM